MAATTPAKPPAEKLDPKVVKTALILIAGGLAPIFDTTIVSVALHTLAVKLDTPVATIQWVSTGYLLALGISGGNSEPCTTRPPTMVATGVMSRISSGGTVR